MNKKEQSRLKSPVFWTALCAEVLAFLVYLGVVDVEAEQAAEYLVCGLCEVLVLFGILNNPTDGGAF